MFGWNIAEPNEALIISGRRQKNQDGLKYKIVTGGGVFVMPGIEKVRRLSLGMREVSLATDCKTAQFIPIGVRGVAIYKIGSDPVSIANAAERFLDQPKDVTNLQIQKVFDGHLRSIIGGMTIEDLVQRRDTLMSETRKSAGDEMQRLGLVIESLQIQEVVDPSNILASLAAPHVAAITKSARIAQAAADQEATQREQEAEALKANATRESSIKRAGYQAEVDKAKAEAAQAGPLAEATAMQNVTLAETKTAQLNADLAEQTLQATVRRPADAQAYSIKITAEADRDAAISRAEAEARRIELDATAKANAVKITGEAQAAATTAIGEAEGSAVRAKLMAEADGIRARGEALAANKDAVIEQTMAENYSETVRAAASAYGSIDNLIVLDGAAGISKGIGAIAGLATTMAPLLLGAVKSFRTSIKDVTAIPPTIDG